MASTSLFQSHDFGKVLAVLDSNEIIDFIGLNYVILPF